MANTVVTLRPNGGNAYAGTTIVGAADVQTALNDNSDASYLEIAAASVGGALVDFADFTLPALAQARSLTARARAALASAGTRGMILSLSYPAPAWISSTILAPTTTITTYTGMPATTGPTGPFSQLQINFMEVEFKSTDVGSVPLQRIYELYLDLAYNQAPVAAVTAPTGTITTRSDPPVVWTYSDPEGDLQERYQVKIFTAAQYGIGGFDPETSPYTWWSGEVFSAALTAQPPPLVNATYRAYVKVADVGSSGRYGAWAFGGYVLNPTLPPTPTLVATADTALSRVKLDTTVGTYASGTQLVTVQRSLDGGATWATVRGAAGVLTANLATFTVYDYEMPRGVSVSYRAQVVSVPSTFPLVSAYSTTATATVTVAGWWLKDPQFPALNMLLAVQPGFSLRRSIPQTIYEGLGAAVATVVTDGARGYSGNLAVWAMTAERWAKLDTLVDSARPLLLEDNLGRAWYVQLGDASEWSLIRAAPVAGETSPIRNFHSVTLPFTQTAAPPGTAQGAGTPTG